MQTCAVAGHVSTRVVGSLVPIRRRRRRTNRSSIKVICASGLLRRSCYRSGARPSTPPTIATRIIDEAYILRVE